VLFLFLECTSSNEIVAVKIYYLPQDLNVITAIDSCDKIFDHTFLLKDTIINEGLFIKELNEKIASLKLSQKPDSVYDFRIRCELKMNDGNKKVLCMGEFFDTFYDGKLYEDSSELFDLIKTKIYK